MTAQSAGEMDGGPGQTPPKKTREEQIALLVPELRKHSPQLLQLGMLYHQRYPWQTTAPEVLDAITVAVPYRLFMLLSGVGTALVAEAMEKDKEASAKAAI
jgi:hypothetical protein